MKSKNLLVGLLLLTMATYSHAQTFTKTGIKTIKLKNSGAIISNDQVKGYYLFYLLDKKSGSINNYLLTVLDENLREINSITIPRSNTYSLIEGAFNGNGFCFLFYDSRFKSTELLAFDITLTQTGSVVKKVNNKFLMATYTQLVAGQEANQDFLIPVTGKGFLHYTMKEGKKQHYEIEFYDNKLTPLWKDQSDVTAKLETAVDAFQDNQYVGSLIIKKETNASRNLVYDLLIQNTTDGKRLFRVPIVTDKYTVSVTNVYYDSIAQNFVLFGEYFDKGDKELKDLGLGFITLLYDKEGKIISQKTNSWEKEISQATPFDEKGKFEGLKANVLFHQTIRTADGQIFMIGEQYKKVVSGAGVALKILSVAAAAATGYYNSGASAMQINIYNMVIFQFNPDYSINRVYVFEKSKNSVMLPEGWGTISPKILSYYAKSIGGFDYAFSQVSADKNTFIVNYINYDRTPESKSKNVLGSIIYTPEKTFVVDKMDLNRKSTSYYINRAKEGYVAVTEYYRKEKKIESRLEKINY